MSLHKELTDATNKLAEASDTLQSCIMRVREARSAEAEATTRVNEAQREFDKLVMAIKKQAPNGSVWSSEAACIHAVTIK